VVRYPTRSAPSMDAAADSMQGSAHIGGLAQLLCMGSASGASPGHSFHFSREAIASRRCGSAVSLSVDSELVHEAVRVARRVPGLKAGLMHPQPAEVVAMGEEPRVEREAARLGVGVEADHPRAYAVRVEDLVP
jgi:hypothetical protein